MDVKSPIESKVAARQQAPGATAKRRKSIYQLAMIADWTAESVPEDMWKKVIQRALEDAASINSNSADKSSARNFLARVLPIKMEDLMWYTNPEYTLSQVKDRLRAAREYLGEMKRVQEEIATLPEEQREQATRAISALVGKVPGPSELEDFVEGEEDDPDYDPDSTLIKQWSPKSRPG